MPYQLEPFHSIPLDEELLELLIDEHETITLPRLKRLWSYYRNALAEPDERGGSLGAPAQAAGLPPRFIGSIDLELEEREDREIVIENDIAWRIQTLVDFMFPEAPRLISRAADPARASLIERVLEAVFVANGGDSLWQDAALLGAVYGHVDLLLGCDVLTPAKSWKHEGKPGARREGGADHTPRAGATPSPAFMPPSLRANDDDIVRLAKQLTVEIVEPPRAIPLLNRTDYRIIDAYIIHAHQLTNEVERSGWLARLTRAMRARSGRGTRRATVTVTEIISPTRRQRYENGELVSETINTLGRLPVVHVQNLSQPLHYHGISDVEPLIPLQDELNTRLSDRAFRVTMQSFRMWLGKGIDGFTDRPIGPGQMWLTDNPNASIEAFGGDADSPSERAHIEELREALDKASGVTPAAAGHIKARVGNLTSENALRISLMGTIAKIKRKRITYGGGIAQLCELILHALDVHGVLRTEPHERRIDVVWADPIAADESRKIADALAKAQLGVPTAVLRAELGYADSAD